MSKQKFIRQKIGDEGRINYVGGQRSLGGRGQEQSHDSVDFSLVSLEVFGVLVPFERHVFPGEGVENRLEAVLSGREQSVSFLHVLGILRLIDLLRGFNANPDSRSWI